MRVVPREIMTSRPEEIDLYHQFLRGFFVYKSLKVIDTWHEEIIRIRNNDWIWKI